MRAVTREHECHSASLEVEEEDTMVTFIFLFGILAVIAIIGAGVYFSGARRARATVTHDTLGDRPNVGRATGSGDD
jgi:hypothetical protein